MQIIIFYKPSLTICTHSDINILPPNPGVLAPKLVFDTGDANNPLVCVVFCWPKRLPPVFAVGVAPNAEKIYHTSYNLFQNNIHVYE